MKSNENQAPDTGETSGSPKRAIRLGYLKLLILITVCFLTSKSFAALDCDSLLAATMKDHSGDSADTSLSYNGRVFLSLIKVGMANLGPEFPALLTNLKQLASAQSPMNPFVNLRSALGLALTSRSELLLGDLTGDWPMIRSTVSKIGQIAAHEQGQRAQDEHGTRLFEALIDVPIETDLDPSGTVIWEKLFYIGETSDFVVLAVQNSDWGMNKIYGVSKRTHDFKVLFEVDGDLALPGRYWIHNGSIFGFGRKPGQSVDTYEIIFRFDPKTGELGWSADWGQPENSQFASRVHTSNTVVGLNIDKRPFSKGEVHRFDCDLFRFVPTGLFFDEANAKCKQPAIADHLDPFFRGRHHPTEALRINRHFKTDGKSLVEIGDTDEWVHWSAADAVVSAWGYESEYIANVSLHEAVVASRSWKANKELPRVVTNRKAIVFEFAYRAEPTSTRENYQSVDNGKSILYMLEFSGRKMAKLLLIDRKTWTGSDVQLEGGPSAESIGNWELVRNQNDDLLLRFDDPGIEVAVWKFDAATRKFEVQLHETFQREGWKVGHNAFIDYEKFKLVGWLYQDKDRKLGLRAQLQIEISRDGGSVRSEEARP